MVRHLLLFSADIKTSLPGIWLCVSNTLTRLANIRKGTKFNYLRRSFDLFILKKWLERFFAILPTLEIMSQTFCKQISDSCPLKYEYFPGTWYVLLILINWLQTFSTSLLKVRGCVFGYSLNRLPTFIHWSTSKYLITNKSYYFVHSQLWIYASVSIFTVIK